MTPPADPLFPRPDSPSAVGVSDFAPLSHLLAEAHREQVALRYLPDGMLPMDVADAYQIQLQTLALRHEKIAGWKVGAPSADGLIACAPLAAGGIYAGGSSFYKQAYTPCGLELEIAFRLNREFAPSPDGYDAADVLAAIGDMALTMEVVSSRFTTFPDLHELTMLADLQNNGALVVGPWQPYRADFPFLAPQASWQHDGVNIIQKPVPCNPAGDPRRLLPWLVNHCSLLGIAVTPEMILACGSYTGFYVPSSPGLVTGQIGDVPPLQLTLV